MIATPDGKLVDGQWIAARLGKLTASNMWKAMSFLKNGKESSDRAKYKMELVAERMTDIATAHHVNSAMEHGIEHEAQARDLYELTSPLVVIPATGVFVEHPSIEYFGATPDAFVGNQGLLEIKCPTTTTHLKWIVGGEVPLEHRPQMCAQLLCTGRQWVDFLSFDPRVPKKAQKFGLRYQPTEEYLKEVEAAAVQFLKEVEELFEKVTTT